VPEVAKRRDVELLAAGTSYFRPRLSDLHRHCSSALACQKIRGHCE
jgi:hypothetical protein